MSKMDECKEPHYRSAMKALSWRIIATTATILIVFAFTGRLVISAGVGGVEVIVKIILYYLHERLWLCTSLRRKNLPAVHSGQAGWVQNEVYPKREQIEESAQPVGDP